MNQHPCSTPSAPELASGRQFSALTVGESATCPRPISTEPASERQFSALSMGKLAPFPHTVCPGSGGKAVVFRSAQCVSLPLAPLHQPRTGVPCGSLFPCRMGGHQNRLSHALRHFKLRNSPLFSRSFAFMREKRKMYSVQKFPCPSGTIASALKIVPKPIDNLRRALYNATMLLR